MPLKSGCDPSRQPCGFCGRTAVYFSLDRNEDSVKTLETILTVEVNHADAHFALGAAYDKIGQGEKAMGHTRSAENLFTKENNSFMMAQAAKNLSHFMRKFRPLVNGDSE